MKDLEGATLLCLCVGDPAVYEEMKKMAASGRLFPANYDRLAILKTIRANSYWLFLSKTPFRVASNVNVSDSFGIAVTNGPAIQPNPAGISRVKEATSLWT